MITALVVIVVVALIFVAIVASRPASFRIERSLAMMASPDVPYGMVADMTQWINWSPWEKLDPNMQREHSGAPSGKGAIYEWKGNGKVGQGRMEIIEVDVPYRVLIKLDFLRPMVAHNRTEILFQQTGGGYTTVTWAMYGPSNFVSKLMGLFVNMDKLIGRDFEAGLSNLKFLAERRS